MRSPWGRVLKAIREDEDAVRSLGKNVYSYKMQSLIIGGVLGASAGSSSPSARPRSSPTSTAPSSRSSPTRSLILGGAARVFGPVVGAIIFWVLLVVHRQRPQRRRSTPAYIPTSIMNSTQVGQVRFMLVGLGLMLLMIFRPQGIFGDKREIALDAR